MTSVVCVFVSGCERVVVVVISGEGSVLVGGTVGGAITMSAGQVGLSSKKPISAM